MRTRADANERNTSEGNFQSIAIGITIRALAMSVFALRRREVVPLGERLERKPKIRITRKIS